MKLPTAEEILDYAFGDTWKTKPSSPDGKIKLVLSPDKAIAFIKYIQSQAFEVAAGECDKYALCIRGVSRLSSESKASRKSIASAEEFEKMAAKIRKLKEE